MSNFPPSNFPPSDQSNPYANPVNNPYAVTTSHLGQQTGSDAESVRRQYLSHEASVKSIGLLYMLGGVMAVLLTLVYLGMGVVALGSGKPDAAIAGVVLMVVGLVVGGIGVLQIYAAVGLRQLKPWARIVATVLSVIGLLGFPVGTLISAYFLYLLQSQKGNVVFSDQYKQIIAQTPHIKYKTSIIVWILLGILVALLGLGVLGIVLGSAR